ncbi:MAG: PaaI family thioesterase [Bacteroidia bacterium]|nr:PaaI family thioesterase [Bacteroidia bacterium]MDW8159657.1 PaaI family thioesterase [Bacteroidia bacterium]
MTNPIVLRLRGYIGKEVKDSPSPVSHFLRGILVEVEEGMVEAEYIVHQEFTNPLGTLHGGIMAAIIDDTVGAAVYTLALPTPFVTITLNIDYMAPANLGETIFVRSEVFKKGKTVINAISWVKNKAGVYLAKASSNLIAK